MPSDVQRELEEAIERILASRSRKKLDPKSNLGWRIMLSLGDEAAARAVVCTASRRGSLSLFHTLTSASEKIREVCAREAKNPITD
jgi:hypothetical protein